LNGNFSDVKKQGIEPRRNSEFLHIEHDDSYVHQIVTEIKIRVSNFGG